MKVLLINKYFHLKGGAEKSYFDTADILKKNGHEVMFFSMTESQNRETPYSPYFVSPVDYASTNSLFKKMKAAGRLLYSFEARSRLKRLLLREKPDIVHLHNIHHQISPSILHTFRSFRIPVVMTLHDYKLACPIYTLLNHGTVCEQCARKKYYHCWLNTCCRDSSLQSLLNTLEMYLHHSLLRIYALVDVFICPSRFLRNQLIQMGLKGDFQVLSNALDPEKYTPVFRNEKSEIVYAGRLSREKGLFTLLKSLTGSSISCTIYGKGPLQKPLAEIIREKKLSHVTLAGHIPNQALMPLIAKASAVVLPSEWYENNPYGILEAFACGKPVIASDIGGIPELVSDGQTGSTFEPGNHRQLRKKMLDLLADSERIADMGKTARRFVEENHNPGKYYQGLMDIYLTAQRKFC